ncbi:hypothetical protein ACOSP7_006422 [Xanthoceras sorbifolium]
MIPMGHLPGHINIPFPFNMLIERPTLYDMCAVSSVYCMKIKFPTENGEGEMKADQSEYRRCVEICQNTLTTAGGSMVATVDRATSPRARKLRKRRTLSVLIQQQTKEELGKAEISRLYPRDVTSKPLGNPVEPLERISIHVDQPQKTVILRTFLP